MPKLDLYGCDSRPVLQPGSQHVGIRNGIRLLDHQMAFALRHRVHLAGGQLAPPLCAPARITLAGLLLRERISLPPGPALKFKSGIFPVVVGCGGFSFRAEPAGGG